MDRLVIPIRVWPRSLSFLSSLTARLVSSISQHVCRYTISVFGLSTASVEKQISPQIPAFLISAPVKKKKNSANQATRPSMSLFCLLVFSQFLIIWQMKFTLFSVFIFVESHRSQVSRFFAKNGACCCFDLETTTRVGTVKLENSNTRKLQVTTLLLWLAYFFCAYDKSLAK